MMETRMYRLSCGHLVTRASEEEWPKNITTTCPLCGLWVGVEETVEPDGR